MTEETCRFIKMARGHVYPEHLLVTVPIPVPVLTLPGCPTFLVLPALSVSPEHGHVLLGSDGPGVDSGLPACR